MAKCEHPGCGRETEKYCHASCCSGETALCDEHDHVPQFILDHWGMATGYFGNHHQDVLTLMRLLRGGWNAALKSDWPSR